MKQLFLSRELYAKDLIEYTIQAYSALCEITMAESPDYYICSFRNSKYEIHETIHEFENYLIDLHNQRGRQ